MSAPSCSGISARSGSRRSRRRARSSTASSDATVLSMPSALSPPTRRSPLAREFRGALDQGRAKGPARRHSDAIKDQWLTKVVDSEGLARRRSRRAVDEDSPAVARMREHAPSCSARQHAGIRLEGRHRRPAHRESAGIPGIRRRRARVERRRGDRGGERMGMLISAPTAPARSACRRGSAVSTGSIDSRVPSTGYSTAGLRKRPAGAQRQRDPLMLTASRPSPIRRRLRRPPPWRRGDSAHRHMAGCAGSAMRL